MIQEYTESLSVAPLLVKMNKSFAIPVSSCIARDVHLCIMVYILWIRSRNCGRPVTRPCYQLIAKPGNKTATVTRPDPYSDFKCNNKRLFLKRAFVRKAGKLSGSVTKVPVYYIQSVAYEVAVISLKVVISLTVPFSILRCVPANSVFEIGIMTPVYVSVIYFCIRSLVRRTSPEHFNRVFSTCAVRKTKTLGTEWMLVVDWLIFRHGVFPAVKSNRVENAPCDVTREILLNIIHTHQIKIRQKKSYQRSIFPHINETEPFSVFVNGTVLQFCIKRTVAMMAQRGVSLNVT